MRDPNFKWAGTVSWGTMRSKDLIPAFLDVVQDLDPDKYNEIKEEGEKYIKLLGNDICENILSEEDAEQCAWYVDELFDILNELAPEGYYFGASECDGSDYGYWYDEEDSE
jgi:hypothetical protein